ncbi:MAG: phage integrase SAM-like domain-containing protein [Candidatus Kapaibacterium sp.]|jgi:hypothetical protein
MILSIKYHLVRRANTYTVVVFVSGYCKGRRLRVSTKVAVSNKKHLTAKGEVSALEQNHDAKNKQLKRIEKAITAIADTTPTNLDVITFESKIKDAVTKAISIEDYIETTEAQKQKIEKLKAALQQNFGSLLIGEIESIVETLAKNSAKEKNIGFFDALSTYIDGKEKAKTKASYVTLKNSLISYNPSWSWKDCNKQGLDGYIQYSKNSVSDVTIGLRITSLKTFLNHCVKSNIVVLDGSYKETRPPKKENNNADGSEGKERFLLTKEQLIQYSQCKFENQRQSLAQSIFLFSTLTAQRVSDIWRIKPDAVINGVWDLKQTKTGTRVQIPLIDKAVQILKQTNYFAELKKIAARGKRKDGIIEPCNDFNKDLKKTFALFGLTETKSTEHGAKQHYQTIAFHDARALFVTLCEQYGYSDSMAASISGHKLKDKGSLPKYQKRISEIKLRMLQEIFQGL